MIRRFRNLSGTQFIALSFFILIGIGTLLLMLPISARDGMSTPFSAALFTATSASCVTGLTVVDTYAHWSLFGQWVLLLLIQIGGLGFVTISAGFALLLKRRIGLKQRGWIKESLNVSDFGGIMKLLKFVLKRTVITEILGAIILACRFSSMMNLKDAVYFGLFHSVSAFCNAGFDLLGKYGMSSFCAFSDDPVVVLTVCILILIGGIGFFVWEDIAENKWHYRRYRLQTKIVLTMSVILIVGGTVLFVLTESGQSFAGMGTGEKWLSALFCAVTPRTAGFNIVPYETMTDAGKLLTIVLMFIGGGSGSTAGGVKLATVCVLLLHLKATLTRAQSVNVFGRRIDEKTIEKATALVTIYLVLIIAATLTICGVQGYPLGDTLFEVVSAVCTVGVTAGLTRSHFLISQLILVFLMYLGRLGSLSFALSFSDHKKMTHITQPVEEINIG